MRKKKRIGTNTGLYSKSSDSVQDCAKNTLHCAKSTLCESFKNRSQKFARKITLVFRSIT